MRAMISTREMSRTYAIYHGTQLAGDEVESVDYGLWLDAHWQDGDGLPDEPCLAEAHGSQTSGGAIVWVEHDGAIYGLLAGRRRGCYRIPIDERPPAIAPMLDDTAGCSTGSIHQERAHATRYVSEMTRHTSIIPRAARELPPIDLSLPPAPPPMPNAGATPELGA